MGSRIRYADEFFFKFIMFSFLGIFIISVLMAIYTESFSWVLIGLGVILALYIDYYIAGMFYLISIDKGYTDSTYLVFAFVFTVLGYLLIVAMPDRNAASRGPAKKVTWNDLPDL